MADHIDPSAAPQRPERNVGGPVPPIPQVDPNDPEGASTQYSHFRTGLSRHRTGLSEHRTDLSEFRTDLSQHRTDLSEHRTHLSDNRTEMSMRRTGMSFQRTRMSADRTMMSEIRTALSLIGFGFTIYQAFEKLRVAGSIQHAGAPRNFGMALLVFGIMILVGGIVRHVQFGLELRDRRTEMARDGLVHADSGFPISVSLVVAICLLALAVAAVLGMVFNIALLGQ
ncbi:DUF202 domain-containing protein [Sphingobium sp. AP49]|uniref:YidH family protein n=1 Tax=Sphingobium sp. AP49 TaxID=1144307 RepID=UPI00026EC8FF|nr:DUF202 domain-containing protein [Sphingobium sp. AP49]WHO39887.1 DUF202 domain-containing protein [Sphingobium sp. AP49]